MSKNPHDALFRFTFAERDNAAALIRSNLPESIAQRIDWKSLQLQDGSHVDAASEALHSDLIFSAKFDGRKGFIYVLLEHQSSSDTFMALRMQRYVLRLWEAFLREHRRAKLLPAVIPLVVYHGDTPWRAPTSLLDLIDLDPAAKAALAPHLPELHFLLDDLTARGERAIRQRRMPVAAMLTALSLLGFPKRDALAMLSKLVDLLRALPADRAGQATLAAVVCYVLEVADPEPDTERLQAFFARNVDSSSSEVVMSAAQKLREQGKAEGLERGRAEGRAEGRATTLLKLLALKFGELPAATRKRVQAASMDELDRLTERVLSAGSLRDVFAHKQPPAPRARKRR